MMRLGALLWAAGAAAACQSDLDCSLNGDCTAGKCDCDAACECSGHFGGGVGWGVGPGAGREGRRCPARVPSRERRRGIAAGR